MYLKIVILVRTSVVVSVPCRLLFFNSILTVVTLPVLLVLPGYFCSKVIVGQISLGMFLSVKDPPKAHCQCKGKSISSGHFVRHPSSDVRLASPRKEMACLSFHAIPHRREYLPGLVPFVTQLGHSTLPHHPSPCCSLTSVVEVFSAKGSSSYSGNTEPRCVE